VDGILFPFTYCRSRRRTIVVTVHPDRSLAVRAPLRLSQSAIRDFVIRKAPWILKVWARMAALPPTVEPSYGEGTPVSLLGESYPLLFRHGIRRSAAIEDGRLILTSPEPMSDEEVGLTIEGWYRHQAREIIPRRLAACHRLMAPEGIPLPPFTVRPMRSRWGSYSYRSGRVCLNLHLLATTPECLDYVIIHELCHIKVRHHGTDFWQMVERYCPGYREAREQLKNYRLP
jgi:predicted metal-dependent hydrolase